jgi:hypothetical protein
MIPASKQKLPPSQAKDCVNTPWQIIVQRVDLNCRLTTLHFARRSLCRFKTTRPETGNMENLSLSTHFELNFHA